MPDHYSNPFHPASIESLSYIEHGDALSAVAERLRARRYRGAICAPPGHGKSAMLQALGDQLMEHGLTPMPLHLTPQERGRLPGTWIRIIRRARPADALLLDGYDLLPWWARAWVLFASRRAGALVVTSERPVYVKTVARPTTSPALLRRLIDQLAPTVNGSIDTEQLYREARGNLSDALRRAYETYPTFNSNCA